MRKRGRIGIRLTVTAGILALATVLWVSPSAAQTYCQGTVGSLGAGAAGFTAGIAGPSAPWPPCESVCPGGVDSHPTDPGMTRMLAVVLSAQARGAVITVQYDIQAARCVMLSATVY